MIKATRGQRMDTVFVLLIFSVFAISVLIVLMLSASIYQNVSEISQDGADDRLVLSYISTKIKKANDAGRIYVAEFHGENALKIDEFIGERVFQTIIYLHDGWLFELNAEKGLDLGRSAGERIIRVDSLEFEALDFGLIRITAGDFYLLSTPLP